MAKFLISLLCFAVTTGASFGAPLKIQLSSDPVYKSIYLQSETGVVSNNHLSGPFSLVYNGTVSDPVTFAPSDPANWAEVTQATSGEYILSAMAEQMFGFYQLNATFDGILHGAFDNIHVTKRETEARPLISISISDAFFGMSNADIKTSFGEFSFATGNTSQTVEIAGVDYLGGENPPGIWLVPRGQSMNWEFSLAQSAVISAFYSPSRQGCQLSISPESRISLSETGASFSTAAQTRGLPVFKYWNTIDDNTQGFDFSVDEMTKKGDVMVLHDPSTNTCMCMSLSAPTGKLADSCYECGCK